MPTALCGLVADEHKPGAAQKSIPSIRSNPMTLDPWRPARPYLIILRASPIYNDETLAAHARALSPTFDGEFWFTSHEAGERQVDSFCLRRVAPKTFGFKGQMLDYAPHVVRDVLDRRGQ